VCKKTSSLHNFESPSALIQEDERTIKISDQQSLKRLLFELIGGFNINQNKTRESMVGTNAKKSLQKTHRFLHNQCKSMEGANERKSL
jgi:hypothetical protein